MYFRLHVTCNCFFSRLFCSVYSQTCLDQPQSCRVRHAVPPRLAALLYSSLRLYHTSGFLTLSTILTPFWHPL